ncbi:MAG: class A beta-lactamase-related serine hydrolase [Candidatus Pacebacteria bacterium]|jgi:beta-lactamase class A|nr:class A beta-lactamase-related serine hydrolase [Candidatus Paceibacterota bacterium]
MKKKQGNNTEIIFRQRIKSWLLFGVVVLSIVAAYVLGMQKNNLSVLSQFSLLDPARGLINQKDLIINVQPLRDALNSKYENDKDISIYFEYLPTGANISINKDAEFYPASLLKVPVAMAVAKKIELGEWKWTNELVLMPTDKDNKFGTLYKEPSNSTFTIDDLVRRSLADSDNSAHFILVRNLEMNEMEDVYEHMGLEGFLKTEGSLSAKKYSVMMRALYSSSYLSEENSQKLLKYLSQSPFKDYIQRGIPEGIPFSHKIGVDDERRVYLDSGIIYAPGRPYLLTVMTKNKNLETAQKMMADISKKAYNYVRDYEE